MPDHERQVRALKQIIGQPELGCILVLREMDEILGMVNLLFTISTAEGGRVILLEDLIVRREHRGRGLGTMLMEACIAFAKENGISRITLLTDGDNAEAIRFYHKHGFQASPMRPLRLRVES
ncbi:GCN5-related N-acetyltransferase [Pedosphaera parvula Ellin514]|uniref:GCN5-related N-acetyltransferase n=2 Tax=Pedosphaera TaxID=1032526 RepID=B9XB87_PEDPL|nr:GCN5-related N-acetyltransferase [Pedosphaera parvula Ellin514]